MSVSMSPVAGALPPTSGGSTTLQQVLAGDSTLGGDVWGGGSSYGESIPGVNAAPSAAVSGGGAQAVQGAQTAQPLSEHEQIYMALNQCVQAIQTLIAKLSNGSTTGGGAPGQVGQCGMPGCTMDHTKTDAAAPAAAPAAETGSAPAADAAAGAAEAQPANNEPPVGQRKMIKPVESTNVTQEYGGPSGHPGTDYSAVTGTPIKAALGGTVVYAEDKHDGYGNCVVIDHGNGWYTRYAHQSEMEVKAGDTVTQGQEIGKVGSTGQSTGPHLHFEVLEGGYDNSHAQSRNSKEFTEGGRQI